jgi:pimeloyl-ACP methyl ester carboxylesterase
MRGGGMTQALAPSDVGLFRDPNWLHEATEIFPEWFAQGLEGYTDDRLADGGGWVAFDIRAITCPVTVLHGEMDKICNVTNAYHTAEVVPNAHLVLYKDLGHFSIEMKLIAAIRELLAR